MKREYYDDLPKECLRDKRGKSEGRINVIDGAIERVATRNDRDKI